VPWERQHASTHQNRGSKQTVSFATESQTLGIILATGGGQQLMEIVEIDHSALIEENERLKRQLAEAERQRERYFDLYNQAPVGYLTLNGESAILEANQTAARLLGVEEGVEGLTQRPLTHFIPPEHLELFWEHCHKLFATGKVQVCEFPLQPINGPAFWARLEARSIPGEAANSPIHRVIVRNVNKRKLAEMEQAHQSALLRGIINNPEIGIFSLDRQYRYTSFNQHHATAMTRLYNAHITLGGMLSDYQTAEDWQKAKANLDRTLAGEHFDVSDFSGDEHLTRRYYNINHSPIYDDAGRVIGVSVFTQDMTEQKQAEEALRDSYEQLSAALRKIQETQEQLVQQERLAAVGQLAAGIAHDFNNIMAVIALYAQLMSQAGQLHPRDHERVRVIEQQAKNAARLTEQILDFSGRTILKRQPLDLAQLLLEELELLRRTLPEHIEILFEQDSGPFMINADQARLQQAITNLALNSRDAMPEGGSLRLSLTRLTVEPGTSPLLPEMTPGKWAQLRVTDSGTGIPLEVMPRLFEPFFSTKPPGLGSGLGLPQVHGIIGQHQGRIGVETAVGAGTTITIYLPILSNYQPITPPEEKAKLPQGNLEPVLVVEDSYSVREALRTILEMLNYTVVSASNGREALELLSQPDNQIALVLSDVVMPEMGGIQLLRTLRQRGNRIPLILLSGYPRYDNMEELLQEGLNAWLVKPPNLEKLAQAVAKALAPQGSA
jgi:PAS domain S-box-containing protein